MLKGWIIGILKSCRCYSYCCRGSASGHSAILQDKIRGNLVSKQAIGCAICRLLFDLVISDAAGSGHVTWRRQPTWPYSTPAVGCRQSESGHRAGHDVEWVYVTPGWSGVVKWSNSDKWDGLANGVRWDSPKQLARNFQPEQNVDLGPTVEPASPTLGQRYISIGSTYCVHRFDVYY